ncbi:MAG TPA: MFS transporter, partial [Terriglobales bacterium]|nr:MFS transporter [Terriglobales bacterium]
MSSANPSLVEKSVRKIHSLRWWIATILFASTVINYLDRQTLAVLSPMLKDKYHWTNTDYANIVIAFRLAYSIGQSVCGRWLDRVGTKRGISISVLAYSLISIFTSLGNGFRSFISFRFLLGSAESANWPAATKAVSEWFPKKERALAAAFFDSGSSIGGTIATFLVPTIAFYWGWRTSFIVPGILGLCWLTLWRKFYYVPEKHPRITQEELAMILADREENKPTTTTKTSWLQLLRFPQTWGVVISKTFSDPVWFFITDWFPIYLVAKGFAAHSIIKVMWVPFIAADLGNFAGGWASGALIKRGWSLGTARKAIVFAGGLGVLLLIPTIFTTNILLIGLLFGLATFAYAAFSTIANVLPTDLFHADAVASVSGM